MFRPPTMSIGHGCVAPQPGDVVFTYEATLHRYALIPEGFVGCLGRRVALVRPDPHKVDASYLRYHFLSQPWRNTVDAWVMPGATVDRIPIERFPDFPITLPPLANQQRIAEQLGAYDDLIDNNRRRMALLENAACQLYAEWFVRLRFPGYESSGMTDGVPETWHRGALPELVTLNPRTPLTGDKAHWYVDMAQLSTGNMLIGEPVLREPRSGSRFRNGDTLLARITPCLENGKTGFVDFLPSNEAGWGSTEFIVMRPRNEASEFVYCLARTNEFREHAIKSMVGSSGRQRVQASALSEFKLLKPSGAIIDRFTALTRPMFRQIRVLREQNVRLQKARDLLLPRLMRGELKP